MLYDAKYGQVTVENPPQSALDDVEEPVFILRGQDALALRVLARYKNAAIQAELPDEFLVALDEVTNTFAKFQNANLDRVKKPDVAVSA